jgi:shikimate dehydrogenase
MTARYALVGHPIAHSPSPAMHNAGFAALAIEARYELRPTQADEVPALLGELGRGLLAGANVTTPLKTIVAASVRLEGLAARARAVNTVWREGTNLVGALTDVDGVAEPLRALHLRGEDALVLGAGGAARAAALALESLGLVVHVAARRLTQAESLLSELALRRPGRALALGDAAEVPTALSRCAVVVQATPASDLRLDWSHAQADTIAFEMLYRPARTLFLEGAQAAGARRIGGAEMLLAQGLRSFEIWTGRPAPREAMRLALERALA